MKLGSLGVIAATVSAVSAIGDVCIFPSVASSFRNLCFVRCRNKKLSRCLFIGQAFM